MKDVIIEANYKLIYETLINYNFKRLHSQYLQEYRITTCKFKKYGVRSKEKTVQFS